MYALLGSHQPMKMISVKPHSIWAVSPRLTGDIISIWIVAVIYRTLWFFLSGAIYKWCISLLSTAKIKVAHSRSEMENLSANRSIYGDCFLRRCAGTVVFSETASQTHLFVSRHVLWAWKPRNEPRELGMYASGLPHAAVTRAMLRQTTSNECYTEVHWCCFAFGTSIAEW